MQRFLLFVVGVLVLFIGFSCINNKSNVNQVVGAEENALKGLSVVGIYEGKLPCADCSTIATVLSLGNDRNYRMRYVYVGKSEEIFEYQGTWSVDRDILSLENIDYSFKVAKDQLNQLDLSGKEIKGDLADQYVLTKVN
ncbi:MAG: copper resistance protein NlpE [Sphingobacterium sp.]